jgi:hypothetical protein
MSCPYTSQQNGKVERIIRSTNNVIRTLLIHASLPHEDAQCCLSSCCSLWICTLVWAPPWLRLCMVRAPNNGATAPNKLAPQSTRCLPMIHQWLQRLSVSWSLHKQLDHLSSCGFWWGQLPTRCLTQSNWPKFFMWVGFLGFHHWDPVSLAVSPTMLAC